VLKKLKCARKVLKVNEQATAAGRGSYYRHRKMIDIPVVLRAAKLLARHAAIEAREAKTLAMVAG